MLDTRNRPSAPTAPDSGDTTNIPPTPNNRTAAGPLDGPTNWRNRLAVVLAWASVVLIVGIVADLSGLLPIGHHRLLVLLIVGVVLIGCVWFQVRWSAFLPVIAIDPKPKPNCTVNLTSIRDGYADIRAKYTPDQIESYARQILYPGASRTRIVEEITPQKRTLQRKLTSTITVPTSSSTNDTMLFPALLAVKGELQDSLTICLDDEPVTVLTHRDYLALTCLVLDTLLVSVAPLNCADTINLTKYAKKALAMVARRGPLDADRVDKANKYADQIEKLAKRAGPALVAAATLVRRLANHYLIVVEIPLTTNQPRQRTLVTTRDAIPDLNLASWRKPLRALHDRLGALHGARPIGLYNLEVSRAAIADSYHLYVHGPDGMYAARHQLSELTEIVGAHDDGEDLARPYARFQRLRGQRSLHMYLRSVPEEIAARLRVSVRFYEVPPGSMAGATLAAGASFVLIYLAALVLSNSSSGPPDVRSDVPALLLAFPAVAGALVGYDNRSTNLVGRRLAALSSAFLTILVSLAATGLFMANEAHNKWSGLTYSLSGIKSVLGVHYFYWQLLTVIALGNVLYALYVWGASTALFYWMAKRKVRGA